MVFNHNHRTVSERAENSAGNSWEWLARRPESRPKPLSLNSIHEESSSENIIQEIEMLYWEIFT